MTLTLLALVVILGVLLEGRSVKLGFARTLRLLVFSLVFFGLGIGLARLAVAAPTLSWDTVTTGVDGSTLANGMEVKSYTVYRCPVNVSPCTKAGGVVVGTVTATVPMVPTQSLDLAGQPFPSNFMATATNIIAESLPSDSVKATPSDRPRNLRLARAEVLMLAHGHQHLDAPESPRSTILTPTRSPS